MIGIQKARERQGKASAFLIKGRPVDPKKIARYIQRKGKNCDLLAHRTSKGKCVKKI